MEGGKPGADHHLLHLGLLTLIGLSVLLYSTLGIVEVPSHRLESPSSRRRPRPSATARDLVQYFFYFAGFAILFSTNVGIMDWVGRLTADSLKVTFLKERVLEREQDLRHGRVDHGHRRLADHMDGHRASHTADPLRDGGRVHDVLLLGLLILLNRRVLPGTNKAQLAAGGDDSCRF